MKTIQKIFVKDLCNGTYTNVDGFSLFSEIDNLLSNNSEVLLSFTEIDSVSSSFLNSSIGAVIEKYGLDVFKKDIRITNYTPNIAKILKKYVDSFALHCC